MKEPHLLRVSGPPEEFAPLAAAMAGEGLRLGWLDLAAAPPEPLAGELAAALDLGVLRAVAVGPGRVVAAKPLRGAPVLRDVLRQHFLGCRLVLVAGPGAPADVPALEPEREGPGGEIVAYRVAPPAEAARRFPPAELAARLRRPRPWGDAATDSTDAADAAIAIERLENPAGRVSLEELERELEREPEPEE